MTTRITAPLVWTMLTGAALLVSGCTRLHTFRLDRLENDVVVTSSSLDEGTYEPVAFLKVSRWRVDPGSMFKRDYESPVGYQLLNDHLIAKARDLGADAIVDVETRYSGGMLFARATATGMAVKLKKREAPRSITAEESRPAVAPRRTLPDVDLTYGTH